ncbi:MAG: hypothetical protein QXK50_03240 [Ignisphaera sp.]
MMKLYIVSKPLNSSIDDMLKVVGFDRKTAIAIVGSNLAEEDYCSRYLCLDTLNGFEELTKNVVEIIKRRGIRYVKLVLGDTDGLTSTAIHTMYMVFNTIELAIDLEIDPLNIVYDEELIKLDFKPRLWLDLRDLEILTRLDSCRASRDIADMLNIPSSSSRRRLFNMMRKGLIDIVYRGRKKIYCPTTLAKIFSYTLMQMFL